MDPYLAPHCRPSTLDSFGNRRLLLRALKGALANVKGRLLDVGCGYQPYRSLLLAPPGNRWLRTISAWISPTTFTGLPTWPGTDSRFRSAMRAWTAPCSLKCWSIVPIPEAVLGEVARVLKPGGFLFLTVPFIWPIHTVPHDEFRYTPFALRRLLERSGFPNPVIEATGGRHAVLALTLGLWVRRRPLTSRVHVVTRAALSVLLWPVIWLLLKMDKRPQEFEESTMIVGLSARACKIQ